MSLQLRTITPADIPAVQALHQTYYWRTNCLLLHEHFYAWQFAGAPLSLNLGGDQSVVALENGQLISYLGVVPTAASCQGRPIRAAHLISWLSLPQARARGVGTSMMTFMTEQYDFLFGRSVTPAALNVYRKLGFRYFPTCERWIAILDAPACAQLAVEIDDQGTKRLAARQVAATSPYEESEQAPDWVEELAANVAADALTFKRDQAYCRWRYEQHPSHRYVFIWSGATRKNLAVCRVEDVIGRNQRSLRVVEFLALPGSGTRLAQAIFAFGRHHGCAFADLFGLSEHFVAGFVAAGGFLWCEEPDIRLPHLLRPWDAQIMPPGLLVFGRGTASGVPFDRTRLHVSRGDGNMDWPSWATTAESNAASAA